MDGLIATDTIVSSLSSLLPTTGDIIAFTILFLATSRVLYWTNSFALALAGLFAILALHFDPQAPTVLVDVIQSTLSFI